VLSKKKRNHALTRFVLGESRAVLLTGVALNWAGAAKLLREAWEERPPPRVPSDYPQLKAFTAGTAATFGTYYLYLYLREEPVLPLLVFGAALKTWAFVLSAALRIQGRLDRANFLSFGVSNGLVAALFWAHIGREARQRARSPV